MGVCSPACAAWRGSQHSWSTQLSVVLFLSLEWKPKFPPPLQNAAQQSRCPQQAPVMCCQAAFLELLFWLLIFSLRIPKFCSLLFRLLLPAQRVISPGQMWSESYWVRYGGGTGESPRPFSATDTVASAP